MGGAASATLDGWADSMAIHGDRWRQAAARSF